MNDYSSALTVPASRTSAASGAIQRRTQRDVDLIGSMTIRARAVEHGRGQLANDVLMITGALSALEAHLIEVAPLGEHRYRMIADQAALGAAQALASYGRW